MRVNLVTCHSFEIRLVCSAVFFKLRLNPVVHQKELRDLLIVILLISSQQTCAMFLLQLGQFAAQRGIACLQHLDMPGQIFGTLGDITFEVIPVLIQLGFHFFYYLLEPENMQHRTGLFSQHLILPVCRPAT